MSGWETVGSWRVALRLAGRAARRSKLRTLLLILMLMLPVYAGSVLVLSWNGTYASPDTVASWSLGRADTRLQASDLDQLAATLPAGSRIVPGSFGRTIVRAGDEYTLQAYETANLDDPIHNGRYVIRTGRAPRGAAEVAVSSSLAETLRLGTGGTLAAGVPPRELTVVGIIDPARELRAATLVVSADHPLSGTGARHLDVDLPAGSEGWDPPPLEGLDGLEWSGSMSRETLRASAAADQALQAAGLILVIGFAGAQTALLVAAAFAVSARRQRRELAMVGAVGANRAQVARMVLANGVLFGALAGAAGLALGIVTFRLSRDRVERIADHPLTDTGMPVGWLAGIGLFAVAVGLLAALGPARGASRQAIRAGLTDREAAGRVSSLWWLTTGLMIAPGGALVIAVASGPDGSIVTVTAGSMGVLFGIAALAPAVVAGCGRIAARFPPAGRLAIRHAARHRLRTAGSVAAVCAAVAGSVAVMLFGAAEDTTYVFDQPAARPGQVLAPSTVAARLSPAQVREVERLLPVETTVPFRSTPWRAGVHLGSFGVDDAAQLPPEAAGLPPEVPRLIGIGGVDLVRAVTGQQPDQRVAAALRDGGAIAFYPQVIAGETVMLLPPDGDQQLGVRVPATLVPAPEYYTELPSVVISHETAARLRLPVVPGGILFDTTRPPTGTELAAANSAVLAAQVTGEPPADSPTTLVAGGAGRVATTRDYGPMFVVLAIVSAMMTLAASGGAVGLATSEMRNDLATLAAVGAGPRLRRQIAAAQAGLIVTLGAPLGILAGIAPAAGMIAVGGELTWEVPWLPLAIAVLIAPVAAVAVTAAVTRPRLVLVRRLS